MISAKSGVEAVHTPGHTPEHLCYLITDLGSGADTPMALITGDFVFVGDVGRPDLLESAVAQKGTMEASARQLQKALRDRLASFDDYLQLLPGHGAGSARGRALGALPTSTLGYQRRFNSALKLALRDDAAFVKDILSGQPDPPLYFATMKRVNRDGIRVTGGAPKPAHLHPDEFSHAGRVGIFRFSTHAMIGRFLMLRMWCELFMRRYVRRFSRRRPVRISRKTIRSY